MDCPRGYLPLPGLCPSGNGRCVFCFAKHTVDQLQRYGPEWKFLNLHVMAEVLNNPAAIFEGLNRIGYDSGYVYSARYSKRYIRGGIEVPAQPGFVGIVVVNPDHRGNVILDWNWRREDPDREGFPENWAQDFGGLRWQRT